MKPLVEETRPSRLVLAIVITLAFWEILAFWLQRPVLPGPHLVVMDLMDHGLLNLGPHLGTSLMRVAAALCLALIFAAPAGMLIGYYPKLDRLTAPFIYLAYSIPKVVLLPVLLVFWGVGDLCKILLIALVTFFPMMVSVRDAIRGIPQAYVDSIRSLGATDLQVCRHVLWPVCLPTVLTSLRVSLNIALALRFVTETYATNRGLGYAIMDAAARFNYVEVFSGVVVMSLMGLCLYSLLDILELLACSWKCSYKR